MSADVEVTIKGDAYRIVPGATYVIEAPVTTTPEQAQRLKNAFQEATGAKCVILAGVRLVPAEVSS